MIRKTCVRLVVDCADTVSALSTTKLTPDCVGVDYADTRFSNFVIEYLRKSSSIVNDYADYADMLT